MTNRPYAHWSDAEIKAELEHLAPYIREAERRKQEEDREARLRRAEAIIADLQAGLPASNVKLERKVDRVARTSKEAQELATVAIGGRVRLGQELQAEIAERKADRDRIERRVTSLELSSINSNRQNPR